MITMPQTPINILTNTQMATPKTDGVIRPKKKYDYCHEMTHPALFTRISGRKKDFLLDFVQ